MSAIHNMIGLGKVSQADDSGELQVLQITQGAAGSGFMDRVLDKVRRIFSFGFTSVPPLGSVALLLFRGGERSNAMVIGTHHQASRPKGLKPGDSAMYDMRGVTLQFTEDGPVLDCAGLPLIIRNASKLTIDIPDIEMTGNLAVKGTITGKTGGQAVELGSLRDAYNSHHHGGVAAGSAQSAVPDHTV